MVHRTLRIPEELYEKVKELAKNRGITCNALILGVLWEYVKRDYLFETEDSR